MDHPIYSFVISPALRALKNLDGLITRAEEYAAADDGIDELTLAQARLFPNMRPLVFQVQVTTDIAKGAAARLSGNTPPSWPDDEQTLADLHARIAKAVDYLSGFQPADFDGAETREIELKLRGEPVHFTGLEYARYFVMPNVYFHTTTAYNILRHNGVPLGKRDFMGAL